MGQNCWASPNPVVLPWKPVDSWTRLRKAPLYHLNHGLRGRLEKVPPYSRREQWQCRELCSWGTRSTAALQDCQRSTSPAVAFTRAGMSPAWILGGFSTSLHALGMAIAAVLWVDGMDSCFCFMHTPHYFINYEGRKIALISGRYSLYFHHFANSVQTQGWEAVLGFLKLVWWRPDLKSVKCLALSLFFEDSFFQSLFTCGTETFMYVDRSRW